MLRLCIEKHFVPTPPIKYGCFLTMTKITPQNANKKGTSKRKNPELEFDNLELGFDNHFQKECVDELLREYSNFHYSLANESDSYSVCSEGLRRIKDNGLFQLVGNLTRISARSKNDYEFLVIAVGSVQVVYRNEPGFELLPLTCGSYVLEDNTYLIPQEFLNFKLIDSLSLTMTSSLIIFEWIIYNDLQYLLKNWTYEVVEVSYRSDRDSHWYPLPNQTVQSSEDPVKA